MRILGCLLLFLGALPLGGAETKPSEETQIVRMQGARTEEEWERAILKRMLEQDFRTALALCLRAQQQYPEQQAFRDYEASIRKYLQAGQSSAETTRELAEEEPVAKIPLHQRMVTAAKQDPLLTIYGGAGLHGASTAAGLLNPFTAAVVNFYFSPTLGLHLFYYDSHWAPTPSQLYSLTYGAALRFRSKLSFSIERSSLSFSLDLGMGLHDLFSLLQKDYQFKPVLLLGFHISDRPFYHFGGIEVLAGLQIDLNFSLYLSTDANSPSIAQTGNWEAILWQSFGVLRLGLSYRGSISEYHDSQQVFFVQNQFALLVGLEWRSSFQP